MYRYKSTMSVHNSQPHVFQIQSVLCQLTPDFTQTIRSFNLLAISHLHPPKKKNTSSAHKKGSNPVGPTKTQFQRPFFRFFHAKLLFKIRILSNLLDEVAAAMSKAKALWTCEKPWGSNGDWGLVYSSTYRFI